jgi:ribosomal protein L30
MEEARICGTESHASGSSGRRHVRFAETVQPGDQLLHVRQVSSSIGAKPKTVGALWALGLRRRGHTNLQPDTASTWGSIDRARHLIEVTPLVWGSEKAKELAPEFHSHRPTVKFSGDRADATSGVVGDEEGTKLVTTRYEVGPAADNQDGTRIDLPDGGVVLLEHYESHSVLIWPTRLELAPFFEAATLSGEIPATAFVHLYRRGEDDVAVPLSELRALERSKGVYLARLDDIDHNLSILWQRSLLEENEAEGGISVDHPDIRSVGVMLEATGSDSVVGSLAELLERLEGKLTEE